jgi:hypothetical protein
MIPFIRTIAAQRALFNQMQLLNHKYRSHFNIAKIIKRKHNHDVERFHLPSDEEMGAAYNQGKEAVIALIHQTVGQLSAQIQTLCDFNNEITPSIL